MNLINRVTWPVYSGQVVFGFQMTRFTDWDRDILVLKSLLFIAVFLFSCTPGFVCAQQENNSEQSAGAASDPTASVNFQDLRFRYLDLGGGKVRKWYNTEGGYMVTPKLKLINELHYWSSDVSGRNEFSFESFHIKAIYLNPGPSIGKVKSRSAVGLEWVKELVEPDQGLSISILFRLIICGYSWMINLL